MQTFACISRMHGCGQRGQSPHRTFLVAEGCGRSRPEFLAAKTLFGKIEVLLYTRNISFTMTHLRAVDVHCMTGPFKAKRRTSQVMEEHALRKCTFWRLTCLDIVPARWAAFDMRISAARVSCITSIAVPTRIVVDRHACDCKLQLSYLRGSAMLNTGGIAILLPVTATASATCIAAELPHCKLQAPHSRFVDVT